MMTGGISKTWVMSVRNSRPRSDREAHFKIRGVGVLLVAGLTSYPAWHGANTYNSNCRLGNNAELTLTLTFYKDT